MKRLLALVFALGAVGFFVARTRARSQPPQGVAPVSAFDVHRYLGKWYEIARLDHFFERGLTHVTAEYSLRPDGAVRVVNRGFNPARGEFQERVARAIFAGRQDVASLLVTFFWPFSGGYHVFILDSDYRYAAVSGSDRRYLWILARSPRLPEADLDRLVNGARKAGFPVDELIYVDHGQPERLSQG